MRMVSQFFSKLEIQADNWRKFQDYISHYFFEKDDINRLVVYIRKIHGSKIASRPEKDIVRARLSTSIKEFPSSELKDKAVVIAAGI